MKILVTGSDGQLGRKIRELSGATDELKFIFASKDKLDITDVTKLRRFFSSEKIDILLNCAAYTNVDSAETTYQQANKVNNFAVKEMSGLSETYDFTFVHISTDYVFDGSKERPYKEKDKTNPLGAYGKSKSDGEVSIMENNCRSIIVRTSWLYSNFGSNFVKNIINLAQEKKSIKVVDDQLGSPTSAKDLSKAIIHMIRSNEFLEASSKKEIFHFCNSGVCSWYELAKEIVKIKKLDCKVIPCKSTEFKTVAKRPFYSALNNEKFSNSFSFEIKPWQEALKLSLQETNSNLTMSKAKNIQVLKPLFRTREVLEEIEDCLEKGWTGIGYKTEEFEEKWKVFTNFNNCHFLNSASSGLHLALKIYKDKLGWEEGDEVITSGLTFISANHAILYENLNPVFADIDSSLCLNPDSVERLISKKTRALIYVGVGGNTGNFKSIVKLCKKLNIILILDAAHMAGTKWKENNIHVGSEADCAVFSFQAVKNLPSGDAGAICFNDKELDQRARNLSWLGIDKSTFDRFSEDTYQWRYDVNDLGFKYHGNSVMAAICLVSLRYLEEDNQYRRDISDTYTLGLKHLNKINLIQHDQEISSSRHLYQISLDKRDDLINFLHQKSIYCGVHYLNNQDYKIFKGFKNEVKMTKYYSDKILSLPLHLNLNTEDIERVINSICSFYSND